MYTKDFDITMSLSLLPIEKKVLYAPEVDLNKPKAYLINKSGQVNTYFQTTTQNFSNSQITFNININNLETIVNRYILVQVQALVTFTNVGAGQIFITDPALSQWFSIRSYPLSQCTSSLSLQINNQTFTSQPFDYITAFAHSRLYQHDTNVELSTFPSLCDYSQNYTDLAAGSAINPMGPYSSGNFYQQGRGSFPYTILTNTPTSATILFTISEPLFISPLLFKPDDREAGLIGVNQLNITLQLANLNRMISVNTTQFGNVAIVKAGTTYQTTIASNGVSANPIAFLNFITPDPIMQLPQQLQYGFENINVFQTQQTVPNMMSNVSVPNIQSSAIQLDQVPSKIYIYMRQSDTALASSTLGATYADSFVEIQKVAIQFNNVSGILSNAAEEDLWRISAKNGSNITWPQWAGTGQTDTSGSIYGAFPGVNQTAQSIGSVLILKPDEDFGLDSALAAGVYGEKFNLQIQLQARNRSLVAYTPTLFVVVIYDGVLTVDRGGSAFSQLGILSRSDVLMSPHLEKVDYKQAKSMWGGDIWSDIKSFGRDVLSGVKEALPVVKDVAKTALELAPLLLAAGKKKGGRQATMQDLQRRMIKY